MVGSGTEETETVVTEYRPTTFSNQELLEVAEALKLKLKVETRTSVITDLHDLLGKVDRLRRDVPRHGVWIITE